MKVMLVTRDRKDLWKHEYIAGYLRQHVSGVALMICCGERNPAEFEPRADVTYVYAGYETFLNEQKSLTKSEIIALHGQQFPVVASSLYQSDRRYVEARASERELALEQVYTVQRAQQLIAEFSPDMMFMTGGGNLIRNVFFDVGQAAGVRVYRVLNTAYLNPGRQGVRYWFSTNNYCRLSGAETEKFDYAAEDIHDHAVRLLESIKNIDYNLDKYARTIARKSRFSVGSKQLLHDMAGALYHRVSDSGRGRSASHRFDSYRNFTLNKRLVTDIAELPEPFFLFPLNVPQDAQLVLRAPHLKDLYSVCEQIANVLPYGYSLVIKEHPGHPGMLQHDHLKVLLRYYPRIYYISADTRLGDILPKTAALITINSTAALEALVNDIPVITMGEAFYRGTGLTYDVTYPLELPHLLTSVITDPKRENRQELLLKTVSGLLRETVPAPGQIEPDDDKNFLAVIAEGIKMKAEVNL
jgi:hypothetical protein